jgi:hypothetical protein
MGLIPGLHVTDQFRRELEAEIEERNLKTELESQLATHSPVLWDRLESRLAATSPIVITRQSVIQSVPVRRKHAGGRPKGIPAQALEIAFQTSDAQYMTEGTLEEWADRIKGTGTLFTAPVTNLRCEYAEAIDCADWRDTIRNRFKRALRPLGKRLLSRHN